MDRRDFLKTVLVAAGAVTLGAPEIGTAGLARPSEDHFPNSVASGDPKADSVIVWTRVVDPTLIDSDGTPTSDLSVRLQFSARRRFLPSYLLVDEPLTALKENDGCVRIKVTGLEARAYYYFRFIYRNSAGLDVTSRLGRTRTAPAPDQRSTVRFAFASCQDYIGRYYNSYLPLLTPGAADLDFLLHLGDFIYETTGDPRFQNPDGERTIRFHDEANAMPLGDAVAPYFAASSLSNYRQLHRTYRSDPTLRAVLERFPLIAIWDDHEFSDDCWQDNGTYTEGRRPQADEGQLERIRNAERAWLEYMPIDDTEASSPVADIIDTGQGRLYPNIRIYRELSYGRTLKVILSDCRSHRADHLIAEDAFPGSVVVAEDLLAAKYAEVGMQFSADRWKFSPYVSWESLVQQQQEALIGAFAEEYRQAGYAGVLSFEDRARQSLGGFLDINYLNRRLSEVGAPLIPRLGAPRGLTFQMMGKGSLFSAIGSRQLLNKQWFDLYSLFTSAEKEDVYGEDQQDFLLGKLQASNAAWNVVCSSVSNTAMVVDLAQDFESMAAFRTLSPAVQFLIRTVSGLFQIIGAPQVMVNADQWDGFPNKRKELLDTYRAKGTVVLLSGDIHSSWVTDHSGRNGRLFEFTGTSISSSTFVGTALKAISPSLDVAATDEAKRAQRQVAAAMAEVADMGLIEELTGALNAFLLARKPSSRFRSDGRQSIEFVDVAQNGIVLVEARPDAMEAEYWLIPAAEVSTDYSTRPLLGLSKFSRRHFLVRDGVLSSL